MISIVLEDKREGGKKETYHFEGGIKQFVEDTNKSKAITDALSFSAKEEGVEVDIALMYNDTYVGNTKSFVNNINTMDGGTHEAGFKDGLTRSIRKYLKENANTRDKDAKLDGNDVREGLVAVVSVRVPEPQFEGQTKGLEELLIDDELFASPYFAEATYLYKKILDRDTSIFENRDMIEYLEEIEES
ncbi:DNA topoisomerase, type IIA, subunit B like protein, partial [Aduncisulcus paluster]